MRDFPELRGNQAPTPLSEIHQNHTCASSPIFSLLGVHERARFSRRYCYQLSTRRRGGSKITPENPRSFWVRQLACLLSKEKIPFTAATIPSDHYSPSPQRWTDTSTRCWGSIPFRREAKISPIGDRVCLLHGHTIRFFDYGIHSSIDEGISDNNTRGIESKRVFRRIDDTTTRIENLSSVRTSIESSHMGVCE